MEEYLAEFFQGEILAVDLSQGMIDATENRMKKLSINNVVAKVMNGQVE